MRKYLEAYIHEEVVVVKEELRQLIANKVDSASIKEVLDFLENEPEATELDKTTLICEIAPKGLPEIQEYALSLLEKTRDPDAIEEIREALSFYKAK